MEVGVVSSDPATIDLPTSAGQLRDGAWIMSGSSIIRNGQTVLEDYGASLDLLSEGDKVRLEIDSCLLESYTCNVVLAFTFVSYCRLE